MIVVIKHSKERGQFCYKFKDKKERSIANIIRIGLDKCERIE